VFLSPRSWTRVRRTPRAGANDSLVRKYQVALGIHGYPEISLLVKVRVAIAVEFGPAAAEHVGDDGGHQVDAADAIGGRLTMYRRACRPGPRVRRRCAGTPGRRFP
jgi:hypothetical protein